MYNGKTQDTFIFLYLVKPKTSLLIFQYKSIISKQGRIIVHRSGFNNENIKNKNKKIRNSKIKEFIFNSTKVKADIF